jgi:hypothetical protein
MVANIELRGERPQVGVVEMRRVVDVAPGELDQPPAIRAGVAADKPADLIERDVVIVVIVLRNLTGRKACRGVVEAGLGHDRDRHV